MNLAGTRRADLLDRLATDGILYASADQPVVSGTGRPAPWMLDSLRVTLDPVGCELAAECLLEVLEGFEGCQLATYGVTALPLLMGCVQRGGGRYRGIVVRKEPRPHGSLKQIEGRYDPAEPVVIIDDSICSGYSMQTCARLLEQEGLLVEGAVCLVRFTYDPGVIALLDRGYRVATVFDLQRDLIGRIDGEAPYVANPTKEPIDAGRSERDVAEGLHPAELARAAMEEYLATGRILAAPVALDARYDTAGGCFVSLRRRADIHTRPARSGFWHFPGEPGPPGEPATIPGPPGPASVPAAPSASIAASDVIRAAVQTARQLSQATADPREELLDCAIAVTFFSALEPCTVGALDNDHFGIVVRSVDRPHRMGGALPRMPGIADERQQFAHALRNAGLHPLEDFAVYRHGVTKVVEPGAQWPATGIPGGADAGGTDADALALLARQAILADRAFPPSDAELNAPTDTADRLGPRPETDNAAFVTVYADGRLIGCMGGPLGPDGAALEGYAVAALDDERFPAAEGLDPAGLAVSVSVLSNRFEIGEADPDWVVGPTRFAEQALEVGQGVRRALLLPSVAVTNNLSPREFVDEVIDKAGITRAPYHWTRYDVVTALADADGVRPMGHGLPVGEPAATMDAELERLTGLLVGYARRHHVAAGPLTGRYEPFADRLRLGIGGARLAYGAWVKARAGLVPEAGDDLRRLEGAMGEDGWIRLDDEPPSISELAFVLLAELEVGDDRGLAPTLAAKLCAQIDRHGRFETHAGAGEGFDVYQDYAPGQALLALALAVEAGAADMEASVRRRVLRYYRMRFRQNHNWGAMAWLAQAFTAWGRAADDPRSTMFAYEVVDWALQFQSDKTGGFLNDHQPYAPGATTAVYLEGVAAAGTAAEAAGDSLRAGRYRLAAARSLRFLDALIYQPRDAAVLPNPTWAMGGVRSSLTASEVRIDHVHHALAAVLALTPASPVP